MHAYLNFLKYEELPNAIEHVYKQQADFCESTCLEENACAAKSSEDIPRQTAWLHTFLPRALCV